MYTNTPTTDTYSQEDVLLTREWVSRQNDPTGAKDEQFLNCFIEVVRNRGLEDSRKFIVKRAGSSIYHTPSVSGDIRGCYYWKDNNSLLYAISDDVYMYNTSTGITTTMNTVFGTTTGKVGFTTFLYDDGSVKAVATDGTTLVTISTLGVVATCADPDLPTPHIPKPVFIDGYLLLVKTNTASIYNSDLNDPLLWTAGNVIDAEMDGDRLVDIDKLNNYVVAFGSSTIEYFWDAGIDTGSPFQRNETPIKVARRVGGVAKFGNTLFYIGATEGGQLDVYKLQDFQLEPVGAPTITRYLNTLALDFDLYCVGNILSCMGHTFYVLNMGTYTFVYDIETKDWLRWSFGNVTTFDAENSVMLHTSNSIASLYTIGGSNIFYKLDDTVYQDNGITFPVRIITEPVDFGTLNRKTMSRLSIIADRPSSNSNISVAWSDDDFQSFPYSATINLNQDLPSTWRLGSFRQRAFRLYYNDNYPLRLQKLQVFINKGRT